MRPNTAVPKKEKQFLDVDEEEIISNKPVGFDQVDDDSERMRNGSRVEDVVLNDGTLHLEIVDTETHKEGLTGVFTLYLIRGRDSLGIIEIGRRFKEFVYLREMMLTRYPGLVVPPLPPKVWKHLTEEVVQERLMILTIFLKQICTYPYYA